MSGRTQLIPSRQLHSRLRNWSIGLATTAVGVTASSFLLDQPIAFFVHQNVTDKTIFVWLHRPLVAFLPLLFLVLAWCALWTLMDRPYSRIQSVGLACCMSFIATNFVNNGLKYAFGRTWPETWIDNNPSLIQNGLFGFKPFHGGPGFASFPSGHTAAMCSVMTVLWWSYPSLRPIYVASVVAVVIGLIGANYHFLSDIISGIFVGIFTGYITVKMSPACSQSDRAHNCVDALGPRDAPPFRVVLLCAFTVAGTFIGGSGGASAQSQDAALRLEAKIPLGDVRGRIDHMAADINRRRLFVAELGNNTVGIVDLGQGKVLQTLGGLKEPQGVAYLPSADTLFIANGGDGSVRLFQGPNYTANGRIDLGEDADNVRVDPSNQHVVVGYGDGALAVIDGAARNKVGEVRLPAHPEGFQLDSATGRAYANIPNAHGMAVVDLPARKAVAIWPASGASANFPMAIENDSSHVLAIFRNPPKVGVFDKRDGSLIRMVDTCGDADDLFVDSKRHRVYVSCGAGVIDIFDARSYDRLARIPTASGARTSLFVPELDQLFVAVRAGGSSPAAIWVFRPQP